MSCRYKIGAWQDNKRVPQLPIVLLLQSLTVNTERRLQSIRHAVELLPFDELGG